MYQSSKKISQNQNFSLQSTPQQNQKNSKQMIENNSKILKIFPVYFNQKYISYEKLRTNRSEERRVGKEC